MWPQSLSCARLNGLDYVCARARLFARSLRPSCIAVAYVYADMKLMTARTLGFCSRTAFFAYTNANRRTSVCRYVGVRGIATHKQRVCSVCAQNRLPQTDRECVRMCCKLCLMSV